LSKLDFKSHGMLKKGNKMFIPPICHIGDCKNIPQKEHFICDYHYQIQMILKDGCWSRNYGCTMLIPQVGRVS